MTANKWYCIAQTGAFDSGCSITVSFDGYTIQFSASVRFGASSINITRCQLPSSMTLSARLRETDSQWFVDILSDKDINIDVTVSDNPLWSVVNSPAGAGNIILSLNNISKEFNTESGGADGGFDEDMLREFLRLNGYTALLDFWTWTEDAGGTLTTKYNIVVEKGGTFGTGSTSESGSSGISSLTIQFAGSNIPYNINEDGVIVLPAYPTALKSPKKLIINGVEYDGSKQIEVNLSSGGGIADSVAWQNVIGRPTTLSEFENDVPYLTEQKASDTYATKTALSDLWYIDENGCLHTRYNIVIEGGGAFGTGTAMAADYSLIEARLTALEEENAALRQEIETLKQ